MAYTTIEQADAYVSSYYSSTDSLREAWDDLDNEDKQVYLNVAERVIDQLPLKGLPLVVGKAFPREPMSEQSLVAAAQAVAELAIQQLNQEGIERASLQSQGVKSYKIGDLSETFKDGISVNDRHLSIVFPFLSDWLGGGYTICHTHLKR